MITSDDVISISIELEDGRIYKVTDPKVTRLTIGASPMHHRVVLIIHAEVQRHQLSDTKALPAPDDPMLGDGDSLKALPQDARFMIKRNDHVKLLKPLQIGNSGWLPIGTEGIALAFADHKPDVCGVLIEGFPRQLFTVKKDDLEVFTP